MPTLPENVEPLDRDGAFCDDEHPTAKSLTCQKRPDHDGTHVHWRNGRAVWWGGPPEAALPILETNGVSAPDLAGFSPSPGPEAAGSRNLTRTAQPEDLEPTALSSDQSRLNARTAGAPPPLFSGEICGDCGSTQMVRTGKCLTCISCGSSAGGCS